jgi:2-amino-4-hydroxy-6-hydroxymethyldihydropteridine diphosphokinase
MPEWRYVVAVGSNIGDRQQQVLTAAALFNAGGRGYIEQQSPFIETAPVGGPHGQGAYLNGAWVVKSDFGPHQLLAELQRIEQMCGRVRTVHWGPRTIDLDLILRDDGAEVNSGVLILPHPRFIERPFVRTPVLAIAAHWPAVQRLVRGPMSDVRGPRSCVFV